MDKKHIEKRAKEYIAREKNEEFRSSVEKLLDKNDWEELSDRFYKDLSFGTGGIRGKIAGGYNRINPFIISRATQGLANYIGKTTDQDAASVVIAYDSRRYSEVFAEQAALVLCANGIKVHLFTSLRTTPELSFAVRKLGATAGIVLTASHNPPEYNGYKVYWSDGGQIVPPHDTGIIEEVHNVTDEILLISRDEAVDAGLLRYIDQEIDGPYIEMVKNHALRPTLIKEQGKNLKVVFTPLHGTGAMPVERVLSDMGIDVIPVPEQREPNGEFPTVEYPNPEETSAMEMAIKLGEKVGADLVMGTDPDGDRLGIAVPDTDGFTLVNGNQLGVLLADYILSSLKESGSLPDNPVLVKTIVTTELQRLIAEHYGAKVYNTLTGFKYIAEKIRQFEKTGEQYVFGGEESYGYLVGTEVRDKDAVGAAAMTAEMALYTVSRNMSVLDHLASLYEKFGYFKEILVSKKLEGQEGSEKIGSIMSQLRESPLKELGGSNVVVIKDYKIGTTTYISTGESEPIDLPKSNVLQFGTEDDTLFSVRPSGTEPKIKFYASARSSPGTALGEAEKEVDRKLSRIEEQITELMS